VGTIGFFVASTFTARRGDLVETDVDGFGGMEELGGGTAGE